MVGRRRRSCLSRRRSRGDGGTLASTTRSWTRPGVPPTAPPSSRCVTARSNGKVATSCVRPRLLQWRRRFWFFLVFFKGWYRLFYKGKSLQMPERCVPVNKCGTHSPLWLAGPHPTRRQGIVTRSVCGHWKKRCCAFKSTPIKVKKCRGNYFVYKFTKPSACYLAYCAGTEWQLSHIRPEVSLNISCSLICVNDTELNKAKTCLHGINTVLCRMT